MGLLKMTTTAKGWLRGKVKAVPSSDSLVLVATTSNKPGPPPEKTITLSTLLASRLPRGGVDEPLEWDSREFLQKLCIGKVVTFKVDYSVPSTGQEFGTVLLGDKNVAILLVAEGWKQKLKQQEASSKLNTMPDDQSS
ncbi:Ribonuclease TUDOR 2 [Turnera subulata]|uniref:Ribonuclease TUDOR 2 n=1 Tax=Turnera subulata TaxID=218843 RepID=A0A9Q0G9K1_9ROSI|nr:Ribonuclease TUDOR 2 [Turnera subulata]